MRLPTVTGANIAGTWPDVTAIVPARDEAAILPTTLPSLLAQDYPGRFRVVVVDDASSDRTGDVARRIGAHVVRGDGPPPGWAGKVAAMAVGVRSAGTPEYLFFTDADVRFPTGALTALVTTARRHGLDVVSQMVRLRAISQWERHIVPAFVYFFAQLYPFSRVNQPESTTAAAAGGCMLVRTGGAAGGRRSGPHRRCVDRRRGSGAPRQGSAAGLPHLAGAQQRDRKRALVSPAVRPLGDDQPERLHPTAVLAMAARGHRPRFTARLRRPPGSHGGRTGCRGRTSSRRWARPHGRSWPRHTSRCCASTACRRRALSCCPSLRSATSR